MNKMTAQSVAEILDRLIAADLFKSEVDAWKNSVRYPTGTYGSFYIETKAKKGEATAEAELEEVVKQRYLHEFANAIEPIALGLKTLVQADEKGELIRVVDNPQYNVPHEMMGKARAIVVSNPEYWSCGCIPQPVRGLSVWGRSGILRLQEIVVWFSEMTGSPQAAFIDLIFPLRGTRDEDNIDGFTVLRLKNSGYLHGEKITIKLLKGMCFWSAIGVAERDRVVEWTTSVGGDPAGWLNFPDADGYLAKHIGGLGYYLVAMAKEFSKKHKHE